MFLIIIVNCYSLEVKDAILCVIDVVFSLVIFLGLYRKKEQFTYSAVLNKLIFY